MITGIARQSDLWAVDARRVSPPKPVISELSSLYDLSSPDLVLDRLKQIDWEFTKDDTSYLAHDLHPYPAKFIPQIPANLISGLSLRGERVWDPFGGSGTSALEALLAGRNAISTDANPLASLITKAKCTALSPEQRAELSSLVARMRTLMRLSDFGTRPASASEQAPRGLPPIPNLFEWFPSSSVQELSYIRAEIDTLADPCCRTFALVAFSSIVLAASFQDGETRYARRQRAFGAGHVIGLFIDALESSLEKHEPLEALLGYRQAQVETADVRSIVRQDLIEAESVDLVITSPPYANSTDYHLYHRFRLFWLGYDPRELGRCEIGSHLRHQREGQGYLLYEEEMSRALEQIFSRLRPGRYAAFVLGDSVFDGQTISTSAALARSAEKSGYEAVGTVRRDVHATRRSFIPPARRAKSEDILILRKPPRSLSVSFHPPRYKMWPYEEDLRRREIEALVGVRVRPCLDGAFSAKLDCYQVDRARRLTFTHQFEEQAGTPRWLTWQRLLENGDSRTARKDPKYLTHGLHAYKGKFYPQLAKSLLNLAELGPNAEVLDPFCGSGTVLLESQLNGFTATGLDMNPLAVLISKAKVSVAAESAVILDRVMKDFHDRIDDDRSSRADLDYFRSELRPEIEAWFPRPVAYRLGWLLSLIERVPLAPACLVLKVLLSSTLRESSQQAPEDLRIRRRKKPIADAPLLESLRDRINVFRERLRHFAERMSCSPVPLRPCTVIFGDSTAGATFKTIASRQFDCVVTSPPYATALPYIDTDRLSLLVLFGLSSTARARIEEDLTGSREIRERQRRELESIVSDGMESHLHSETACDVIRRIHALNNGSGVGFRRRNMAALLIRYFSHMWNAFQNVARVVKPEAHLFFVIGDNKTIAGGKTIIIPSTKVLIEMGELVGWRLVDATPIRVTREAPLHSRHAITENAILHFMPAK